MAAIAGPREWVQEQIASLGSLDMGAINGPNSLAVGGPVADVEELLRMCKAHDLTAGKVAIDYASHSRQIEPLRGRMLAALAGCCSSYVRLPFYSDLDRRPLRRRRLDARHWYRAERGAVEFERATRGRSDGRRLLLQISPAPRRSLEPTGTQRPRVRAEADVLVSSALRRGQQPLPPRLWTRLPRKLARRSRDPPQVYGTRLDTTLPMCVWSSAPEGARGEPRPDLGVEQLEDGPGRLAFLVIGSGGSVRGSYRRSKPVRARAHRPRSRRRTARRGAGGLRARPFDGRSRPFKELVLDSRGRRAAQPLARDHGAPDPSQHVRSSTIRTRPRLCGACSTWPVA